MYRNLIIHRKVNKRSLLHGYYSPLCKFLSFACLCKDTMSQFCFYLSILTRPKLYTLEIVLFALQRLFILFFIEVRR